MRGFIGGNEGVLRLQMKAGLVEDRRFELRRSASQFVRFGKDEPPGRRRTGIIHYAHGG
jgi:hypothetical protein